MSCEAFYGKFHLDDQLIRKAAFNPYYLTVQSGLNDMIIIEDEEVVDLASNNYLGIANDQRVKRAVVEAVNKYGASMCATPISVGFSDLYKETCQKLSSFIGLEDSLIYPSCYQANNGVFSAIAKQDDVIVIDQFAHSSLIEGARATGCKIRPFLHNNLDSLQNNLKNCEKYSQIFVVTESVFSTEGSIAPFNSIVDICRQYSALPVIDDSHGIGVLGATGKGILEHLGITDYDGIYLASLGKALANLGGVVSGKKSLIDYLKYFSSHLVYSTALPPHVLAGILEVLNIIEDEFDNLSQKMWFARNTLRDALSESGYQLSPAEAPIISIRTGDSVDTILFAKQLFINKIISTPFIYPSVPKNKGVIRMIAGANLSTKNLDRVISCFKEIKRDLA
ncbi:aminotransferase class I/II-fold pyridoxal phosphate-dependent enzyme [Mangrovibacterium lignilyticum]|uniref:aminotransferase class I/II-fold pyridoxal phosphate-dependent enzyme n=1 Tax=Mangrovibacterium lignilyticum TaxID=2668052 RepID=UPI0013D4C0EF|nr:pyridoxal phosphate-dependent aminotransferase family protein [Mangrovibacterium lignilyticum]